MGLIAELYRLVGFAVCHQLPERSLFVAGRQLPVCARDTGIYVGFLVAFLLLVALEPDHPRDMPRWPVLVLCGLFVAAMGLDGVTSYAGIRQTTNDLRLITGLLAGFALPPLVLGMLNFQLWANGASGCVMGTRLHQLLWLAAVPATFFIVRYPVSALGGLYATVTVGGVLVAFTSVNLVMVTLVPVFERRAKRPRDVLPLAVMALVLTSIELGLAGWLHAAALGTAG